MQIEQIRRRNIIALSLIALVVTTTTIIIQLIIAEQKGDAVSINQAGMQRMLSQRIALFAHRIANAESDVSITRSHLGVLINKFKENHEILIGRTGQPVSLSLALEDIYFNKSPSLDSRVNEYIKAATRFVHNKNATDSISDFFREPFLQTLLNDLDQVVKIREEAASQKVLWLSYFQYGLWVIAVFLILFERAFIFKPIEKELVQMLDLSNREKQKALELEKKAQAASQSKSEFLGNISHEMTTPMNGIIGMLELLAVSDLSNEQQNRLALAKSSARSLLGIITNLLDFSKMDSGQLIVHQKPFNLRDLCRSILRSTHIEAESKLLSFHAEIDDSCDRLVVGDPDKIARILNELLSNAIKFTEQGDIKTWIQCEDLEDNRVKISVRVSDTGIGIEQENQESLFNLFSQHDTSSVRKQGGVGIGLTIARKLCELMDGSIQIKSTVNQGSTFEFFITVKAQTEDLLLDADPSTVPEKKINQAILIVDDMEINRHVLGGILDSFGYQYHYALDGLSALEMLQSDPDYYGLIFMDCQMPRMDGFEATRQIRQGRSGENYKKIPIIAVTANTNRSEKEKCLTYGMDGYLNKPIITKDIREILSQYLRVDSYDRQYNFLEITPEIREKPLDLPHPLVAIDVGFTSGTLVHRPGVFLKILGLFVTEYEFFDQKINFLIEENDKENAVKLCHALRGVSGNLGMKTLYDESSRVETLCKDTESILQSSLFNPLIKRVKTAVDESRAIILLNQATTHYDTESSEPKHSSTSKA